MAGIIGHGAENFKLKNGTRRRWRSSYSLFPWGTLKRELQPAGYFGR
jgi:hypothetical protein